MSSFRISSRIERTFPSGNRLPFPAARCAGWHDQTGWSAGPRAGLLGCGGVSWRRRRTIIIGGAVVCGREPCRHRQSVLGLWIFGGAGHAYRGHFDHEFHPASIRIATFVIKFAEDEAVFADRLRICFPPTCRARHMRHFNLTHDQQSPDEARTAPVPGRNERRRVSKRVTAPLASSVSLMA